MKGIHVGAGTMPGIVGVTFAIATDGEMFGKTIGGGKFGAIIMDGIMLGAAAIVGTPYKLFAITGPVGYDPTMG